MKKIEIVSCANRKNVSDDVQKIFIGQCKFLKGLIAFLAIQYIVLLAIL